MATRTTEAVLRQEVAKAEHEIEARSKRLSDAEDDVKTAVRKRDEWKAGVAESKARLARAEAALAAYLPLPLPGATEGEEPAK